MRNISEFERTKPRGTYSKIKKCAKKYEKIIADTIIMEDEDLARIEMANDFLKDLSEIKKSFLNGE